MSERQETIEDIIAEKRRRAEEIERDCAEKMKRGEMVSDCYARELVADIRREADRLEAANKREREKATSEKSSVAGNAAKLREALKAAELGLFRWLSGSISRDEHRELVATIKTALAAPPRNCDRFKDALDAWDAYDAWVDSYRAQGKFEPFNEFGWLFALYKEGGAK